MTALFRPSGVAACLVATLVLACTAGPAVAESTLGRTIEPFTLQDYRGKEYSLAATPEGPVVVAFLGTECPLAKLYGPKLQQLADKYADQGLTVIGVSSNVQDSVTELGSYARRHELKYPLLKDVGNHIADQFHAQRTPEVFLLDAHRRIVYHGRIDDQYVVGVQRGAASREDLKVAIDELLAGTPVSIPETQPLGCLIGRVRAPKENSNVTYSNQIARLFNQRCVECHRDGEIGPFALTTYDESAGWGEMIAEVVRDNRMPPWHADPAHGHFKNARRLSDEERELIETWVANGCPEGNPAELPEAPVFTAGWQLPREPDAVYAMRDTPFDVPAEGGPEGVRYQRFEVDPQLTEDKWFNSSEVQPGVRSVVHHIIVFAKLPQANRRKDWIFLTAYVPGLRAGVLPEGAAKRIPAGSKFVFEVHYTPDGTPHQDLSRVGFCFVDPSTIKNELVTTEVVKADFVIKPNESNAEFTVRSGPIPQNATVLSLSPHMHLRGKSFRFEAIFPNKEREVLLDVPHYDFNWQTRYILAEPRQFEPGTRILCTAAFDNSADNLANPNPDETVKWGDQSWEEMMIGYFDVLLPRDDTRKPGTKPFRTMVLLEDVLERLDKDKSGEVSKDEAQANAALANGFDKLDLNQDGALQRLELEILVAFLNKQLGD